ncbi:hypothetical protein [Pseudoroseomonas ludipueritiae]|uniref:Uncharacterized protein n=1 Tax=Pseudoroseomonas ludipueritiae TaxID=198093 RepID=A0ABR7R4X3_9PROT|nr:hypothetical protein [Pseudoroseomonas ludipueritiae]MBC9176768.1 hypothetical protein [Pseudoroseomonas ludipueritiae]
MSELLAGRRAEIRKNGRSMVLTRQARGTTPAVSVTLLGFPRTYRPQEIQGGVQVNDQQVETLHDEIAAAGWPFPPAQPDRLVIDGRTSTVKAARPIFDGPLLIGWSIWVS